MPESLTNLTPLDVLMRLPAKQPAYVLHSGAAAPPWSRYSIIALPRAVYRFTAHSELIELPDGGSDAADMIGQLREVAQQFTHDPLRDFEALQRCTQSQTGAPSDVPFTSGWIGMCAYELGTFIEPTACARKRAAHSGGWPIIEMGWCPRAHVYDNVTQAWVHGVDSSGIALTDEPVRGAWEAGALAPTVSREQHIDNVARTIEHIRAGDIFQANITQQFTSPFTGSTRAFARDALEASGAWYGAMLELTDGRSIVSMSPELFLAADHNKHTIITRPIKGTRPRNMDVSELEHSEKDKAELAMIVDLMRNDLGRVCEIGSIKVPKPRAIETHGAVHQGVGEVSGNIPLSVSPTDLLRATFPPGSVTGAPKIRAMQIIDELEASPRGPYCGAIGVMSGHGHTVFNVAIRTVALQGERTAGRYDELHGTIHYGAGGGIVVDSEPTREWDEALAKTQLLRELIARTGASPGEPGAM